MGQVIAGKNCSASLIGAAAAICTMLDARVPPVRLPSLAYAAAPPDLPPTARSNADTAQVGVWAGGLKHAPPA